MEFKQTPGTTPPPSPKPKRVPERPSLSASRATQNTNTPRERIANRPRPERTSNPLSNLRDSNKKSVQQVQKVIHRIEIKFLFPQFAKDSIRGFIKRINLKVLLKKIGIRRLVIAAIILIVLIVGYIMYQQLLNRPIEVTQDLGGGVKKTTLQEKPTYSTVLPSGKSIEKLGGWTRVSPPDRNPVFAYADTIGKIPINVSQQPIPKDAKSKDDFVATLAKAYLASDKVTASDKTVFYVGTSTKGPQSVIFAKGDTLILIRSSAQIEDTAWANYVSSLR